MKKTKQLIVILLLAAFVLTMAACGNADKEKEPQPQETAAPAATATPEPAATPEPTATPAPFEADDSIMMPEGTLIG